MKIAILISALYKNYYYYYYYYYYYASVVGSQIPLSSIDFVRDKYQLQRFLLRQTKECRSQSWNDAYI